MDWSIVYEVLYWLLFIGFVVKITIDTRSSIKAAAYILLIILLPFFGMIIYLSFGLNYRKSELYNKKLEVNEKQSQIIEEYIKSKINDTKEIFYHKYSKYFGLSRMLYSDTRSLLTKNNDIKILVNGENKFPELIKALESAKDHIHMEYYIYSNDAIGNQIAEILMRKAREGVSVRFIYDDFGARAIRKTIVPKLIDAGVEAYAFYEVFFINLANRLNYRNHRKIVVIDSEVAFVGGINIDDKYSNDTNTKTYWRDTHLKIKGEAIWKLQQIFLADWNYCANQSLKPNSSFFKKQPKLTNGKWAQIIASGPDSKNPSILYSYLHALAIAKREILITTPYFIPNEEFLHAMHMAVLRNVKVKLLVPEKSDSFLVGAVGRSYYRTLLNMGIQIYTYTKGFIHAKTMVCDDDLSFVGTANLDNRSFDLNFEVNALVYDKETARELKSIFEMDLRDSVRLSKESWNNRKKITIFFEKFLRLISPLL